MLKFITFRSLNLKLDRFRFCTHRNGYSVASTYIFKHSRSISTEKQSSGNFSYQYDVDQLHHILSNSKAIRLPTINEFQSKNLQELFNANEILDNDVQSVINYVILAAKCGVSASLENDVCNSFLNRLSCNIEQMSADDVVSALIALHLLKVPLHHPVNRELTIKLTHMLRDLREFPLIPLTNLAIYARENRDKIYTPYLCANADSHVLEHLNKCESLQELYYITVCFECLQTLTTKHALSMHKAKMKTFLEAQFFDAKANLKILFEILKLYGSHRGHSNSRIIRNILLAMAPEIQNLSNSELLNFALNRDSINEPASLIEQIVKAAESRPTKSTDLNLIYCRLPRKTPENLKNISKDLETIIDNLDSKDIIKNVVLFSILRKKGDNSMRNIYAKYWDKITDDLSQINYQGLPIDSVLYDLSYRYCLIQKRTQNRFRCKKFESLLRDLVLIEIEHGATQWEPYRLAALSTFIIAYANDPSHNRIFLPEYFVQKIEEMGPQFSITDITDISMGVELFHRSGTLRSLNRKTKAEIADRIRRLENVVHEQIERIIDENKNLQIDSTCSLIRAYAYQKGFEQTRILEKLTKKLENICSSNDVIIQARTIRRITGGLSRIVYIVPKLCERLLQFVNENMDIIDGETVSHLLYYLFSMGYEPNNDFSRGLLCSGDSEERKTTLLDAELFDFNNFIRIIERDFEFIPAWGIIQACLALSFYQVLPLDMINRVFCIEFLTRLENELSLICHKDNSPKYILNLVMQLNRSICLNYPEARVPWFQQRFIEAQLAADPPKENTYMNEIYKMLLCYVGGDKSMIRMNHKTPYGYRIPFVIYFNSHRQLVQPPFDEGPQTLNKVAIIPLFKQPAHFNGTNKRGFDLLQELNLSILGYDVLQIGYRDWNSIHMNLPGVREEYLKKFFNKYSLLVE